MNESRLVYMEKYNEIDYEHELRMADHTSFETTVKFGNYLQRIGSQMNEDHHQRTITAALEPLKLYKECAGLSKYQ